MIWDRRGTVANPNTLHVNYWVFLDAYSTHRTYAPRTFITACEQPSWLATSRQIAIAALTQPRDRK